MTLTSFLNSRGFYEFEGHTQQVPHQVLDLITLTSKANINVMEIGFNAGHSAEVFLEHNKTLTLTSFDLGYHGCINSGKEYLDLTYPNRHRLILGDSRITVPFYIKTNKDTKFDVIFIDGGHDYSIGNADLNNCAKLAHKDTIVIFDDTMYTPVWIQEWNTDPTRVWRDNVFKKKVLEIGKKDYQPGRGMSWGKFNLN